MIKDDLSEGVPTDIEYLGRISNDYASLSKSHKRIAKYILSHREDVIGYSITQLASKTQTAPSTITRFCQALSYRGFSEFKLYMEKSLLSEDKLETGIRQSDNLPVIMQKQMKLYNSVITDTMRLLSADTVYAVVECILNAGTIHIYGQSGGYISALYGRQMFLRGGICTQAFNDNVDMNLAATTLGKGDVAICIAYSGEIKSVVEAISMAKKRGATVVAITANPNSSMAKTAEHVLLYSYSIPDSLQYLYMGSMCELAVFGAIQAEVLRRQAENGNLEAAKISVKSNRIK